MCSHLSMATVSITLCDNSRQFMPYCVRWAWPTWKCHVSAKTRWKTSGTTGWSSFARWRGRDWILFHTHLCVFIFLGTVTCSILAMETRLNVSLRFKTGAVFPHCPLYVQYDLPWGPNILPPAHKELVMTLALGGFACICSHRPSLILFLISRSNYSGFWKCSCIY